VNPAQPNRSRGRPKQTADEAAKSHQKTLQKKGYEKLQSASP
jgi:hypothetical protein